MPKFLLPTEIWNDTNSALSESRLNTRRARQAYELGVREGFGVKTLHPEVALDHAGMPDVLELQDLDMRQRSSKMTQQHHEVCYLIGLLYGTMYKCKYGRVTNIKSTIGTDCKMFLMFAHFFQPSVRLPFVSTITFSG